VRKKATARKVRFDMKRSTGVVVRIAAVFLAAAGVVVESACGDAQSAFKQLPSSVEQRILDSLMVLFREGEIGEVGQFEPARSRVTAGMIDQVQSTGLDRAELFVYGKLLDWADRDDESLSIMENLGRGDDSHARDAWKWRIAMTAKKKQYDVAGDMITEYRKKFKPAPEDVEGMVLPVRSLAMRYDEMNQPENALGLYLDELDSLPFNAPYNSFRLAEDAMSLLIEADRIAECRAMLDRYGTGLRDALARHEKKVRPADSATPADSTTADAYHNLIDLYDLLQRRLDLIGAKAPALEFEHVYNADSTLNLDDLAGTIVVIDFWATWCLPCIDGYKELRRIYDDFHDRGVEILGVTSFQGSYRDMDTGETEGSEDNPMSREREIAVTRSFIEKHGMSWPCAFSSRSVFDPAYTVSGIPTFVILDREGRVRFIHCGRGSEQLKRRIIASLLSESPKPR
jgi:thiol-disulfide isomerase/thioredoxin